MGNMDELLQRNQAFAGTDLKDRVPAIPFIPNRQVYVITCIDPRVDPAGILGLELGDAIVGRNGRGPAVGGASPPGLPRASPGIRPLTKAKPPPPTGLGSGSSPHPAGGPVFRP